MIRKSLNFAIIRYVSYILIFVRGLLFAKFLLPVIFAEYSFATLALMYLSYLILGTQLIINLDLSLGTISEEVNNERIGSAIIFLGTITAMLIGLAIFVPFDSIEYLHEFNFGHYALVVAVLAGATLFKELFVNIQQVKGRFYAIALTEIGSAIILLTPFFFFQGETLIYVSLLMMASTLGVSALILSTGIINKASFTFQRDNYRYLIANGLKLYIPNVFIYLIPVVTRSFVSVNYTKKDFAVFSFAVNIANAFLLGLNSILWTYYPKIINRVHNQFTETMELINKINKVLPSIILLFVTGVCIFVSLMLKLFPNYSEAQPIFYVVFFAQSLQFIAFAFNAVILSKKDYLSLSKISLYSFLGAVTLASLFSFFKVPLLIFSLSIAAGLVINVVYTVMRGSENSGYHWKNVLFSHLFDIPTLFSFGVIFSALMMNAGYIVLSVMFAAVVIINVSKIRNSIALFKSVVRA